MPVQEIQGGSGQPGGMAPSADPSSTQGIQPGGMTPEVEAALALAPTNVGAIVRDHLAQTAKSYTNRMMENAQHVRTSKAFTHLAQDPEFAEYLRAREGGDLAGFHRRKAGVIADSPGQSHAASQNATFPQDNLNDGQPAPAHGVVPAQQAEFEALNARITAAEATARDSQATVANMLNQTQLAEFQESHPDWKLYAAGIMDLVESHRGTLSYANAYTIAQKAAAHADGVVPASVGGTVPTGATAPPPPAVSLGAAARASEPLPKFSRDTSRGVAEAWAEAEKQLATGQV